MIITVTERGNFRRCKRLWDYTSPTRMFLSAVRPNRALALGSLVHASLESWLRDPACDPQEAVVSHAAEMLVKMEDLYRVAIGTRMSDVEKQPFYEDMNLAHNMIGNYVAKWGQPIPEGYTLIEPEQQCLVDIPGAPDNWHCKDCNTRWWRQYQPGTRKFFELEFCDKCKSMDTELEKAQLEGKLDGFVADKKGELYVLEHKTYGNRPRLEVLQMNDQFLAYVWILTKLFPERTIGGLLYDGLWKRDNKPIDECFMRHVIDRPPEEVAGFEANLRAEYMDMMNTTVAYPNRNWMGCTDCGFEKLCAIQSRGEDMEWYLSENFTVREKEDMVFDDDE